MSLTLLAPVSLAQAVEQLARQRVRVPGLESLLASAMARIDDRPLDVALGSLLGIRAEGPPPAAALALATESVAFERDAYWLCADPVSMSLTIDNAQVDARVADLARADADLLIDALNAAFAGDGLCFMAPDPSRWYVRCPADQDLSTVPLWRAIGGSMRDALPRGNDGQQWRARMNESQMLLHAHPVNDERESHGLRRVGSLWWWGGGRWPVFATSQIDRVIGGPRWVRAACAANGVEFGECGANPAAWIPEGAEHVLCILRDDWASEIPAGQSLVDWDERWFQPLSAALSDGKLGAATIRFDWAGNSLAVECTAPPRSRLQRWLGLRKRDESPTLEESLGSLPR